MRDAFVGVLMRLAEENPDIVLVTGDLGFGVLTPFKEKFPAQYVNAGVAEQNMTGIATGLAVAGKVVFTYSIANFPTLRCLEQVRNDACYHNANVKIVAIGGGFSYGALGFSHHATEDLSIMRALPDITVVVPGDIWETEQATEQIVHTEGTVYFRLDKGPAPQSHSPGDVFQLGKARMVREGRDVTLMASGGVLAEALPAAEELAGEGIECRILSMHTLKPLDTEAVIAACRETGGIVTIEENTVEGGLGGAVSEVCLESGVSPRWFHRVGLRAGFSSIVGSQQYLRGVYGIDAKAIAGVVKDRLRGGSRRPG